jgi:mono/diheme cytochrome c family protein
MMYIEDPAEIREWILDGRPARLKEALAGPKALLTMPAYRDHITPDDLNDLVAWYQATAWYMPGIPDDAREGRSEARRAGCFGCHGQSGLVGQMNPGAFKGYVPAWGSEDYFELVRDEAELRAWILDGVAPRLANNAAARFFAQRQVLKMPAYRHTLSPKQLESIISYIKWVIKVQPGE